MQVMACSRLWLRTCSSLSLDSSSRESYFFFSLLISCWAWLTWSFSLSRSADAPTSCCSSSNSLNAWRIPSLMKVEEISKVKGLADRSMRCSPGTLLLQNVYFALDLSLQFYHMTGQLKAQKSDITIVVLLSQLGNVALPTVATRGDFLRNPCLWIILDMKTIQFLWLFPSEECP